MKKLFTTALLATGALWALPAQAQQNPPPPAAGPTRVVADELRCQEADAVQTCVTPATPPGTGVIILTDRRTGRALPDCTVPQDRGIRLACVSSRDVRRAECQARRGTWNEEAGTCRLPRRPASPTAAASQACTPAVLDRLRQEIAGLESQRSQGPSRARFARATALYGVATLCADTENVARAAGLVTAFATNGLTPEAVQAAIQAAFGPVLADLDALQTAVEGLVEGQQALDERLDRSDEEHQRERRRRRIWTTVGSILLGIAVASLSSAFGLHHANAPTTGTISWK